MSSSRAPLPRLLRGLLALAAALAPISAATQESAPAPERPPEALFIDRVEVNLVDVEVFVTDRRGRRVTDLAREDFEVRVDGRPVEITNFYASTTPPAVAAAGAPGDLATASPGAAASPAGSPPPADAAIPREQRLNLMVYVDHTFIQPGNRRRVLDHLRRFLAEGLDDHTWVMLVGYGGSVQVEAPLTRDRETLAAGVEALGGKAGGVGPLSIDRVVRVLRNTEQADVASFVSSFVAQEEAKLRLSLGALEGSLALFAGLPGRKAVLHVSDGLPAEVMQLATALYGGDSALAPGMRNGERRLYDQLVRAAQAHQIAFYPMDTRGPGGHDLTTAEMGPLASFESAPGISNVVLAAGETLNRQEPLLEMAAATGGSAILNTFNFDRALEAVAVDFASFYSLGFVAPNAGDGRRHAIDVRVTRPGLRVRHREGYVDKPLLERVGDRTLSFLHLGMESNPLGIHLGLGTPRRDGRQWIVPLLVRVPAGGVALVPQDGGRRGRLHVFLAVRDDRGRVSKLTHLPHPLEIADGDAAAEGGDVGIGVNVEVRPGAWTLAVGVWDELGGGESYVRQTVEVLEPEPEAQGRRGRRSR
jgi:VWFA-related protein